MERDTGEEGTKNPEGSERWGMVDLIRSGFNPREGGLVAALFPFSAFAARALAGVRGRDQSDVRAGCRGTRAPFNREDGIFVVPC